MVVHLVMVLLRDGHEECYQSRPASIDKAVAEYGFLEVQNIKMLDIGTSY
jgi:hypothetical protein